MTGHPTENPGRFGQQDVTARLEVANIPAIKVCIEESGIPVLAKKDNEHVQASTAS
jgi:hypothetical protein